MTPRTILLLLRSGHVALGVILGTAVYLPTAWAEPLRPLLAVAVVPVLAVTGLAMWQQARLRRLLSSRERDPRRPDSREPASRGAEFSPGDHP